MLDVEQIQKLIPHRYPFLLVDRILELEEDKRVVGLKNVTINEPFFQGHFPDRPIVPGVLMVEALAQTAGVLLFKSRPALMGKPFFFTGIDGLRFRRPVVPGDSIRLEVEILAAKRGLFKLAAKATVEGQTVVEGEISVMVSEG